MPDRVFCIGNGESRKDKDLYKYKPFGKMYGCNAIYRDHPDLCDCLTSVDHGMIHEIYHSGYAQKVPCYFRGWTPVPAFSYDKVLADSLSVEDVEEAVKKGILITNERGDSKQYVMHGGNLEGIVAILKKDGDITRKNVKHATVKVSWIKEPDYSHSLDDIDEPKDHGWACGATSGLVAVKVERPNEIFLIGHDLYSHNKFLNNLYKSTKHYTAEGNSPTPAINWINQWKIMFNRFPQIQFYKVNLYNDGRDKVSGPIEEWYSTSNLKYIDYSKLDNILGL